MLEKFERGAIGDARQDNGRRKERDEAVGRDAPSRSGLTQVLKGGHDDNTLSATLGDDARETRQWGDVGEFIEGEEQAGTVVVSIVRGVNKFIDHAHNERRRDRLVPAGRDDMQLVGATEKLGHV